jgi:hypothetical protein
VYCDVLIRGKQAASNGLALSSYQKKCRSGQRNPKAFAMIVIAHEIAEYLTCMSDRRKNKLIWSIKFKETSSEKKMAWMRGKY